MIFLVSFFIMAQTNPKEEPPPKETVKKELSVECSFLSESKIAQDYGFQVSQDDRSAENTATVSVLCRLTESLDEEVKFSGKIDAKMSACSTDKNLCSLFVQDMKFALKDKNWAEAGYVLVKNNADVNKNLKDLGMSFKLTLEDEDYELTTPDFTNTSDFMVAASISDGEPYCEISVSGVFPDEDISAARCLGECTPSRYVSVENANLAFRAVVPNIGSLAIQSTKWSGGPNANGELATPALGKVTKVAAKVALSNGKEVSCALSYYNPGVSQTVTIQKLGDCPYFVALRNYYFNNANDSAAQKGGYSKPLEIAGINARYGIKQPEVPFAGVADLGYSLSQKDFIVNQLGSLTLPPISERLYSKAVIVAYLYNQVDSKVGDIVSYGTLDVNNFLNTRMYTVPGAPTLKDNDLVVFSIFLAHKQMVGGRDIRGIDGGIPYYQFTDNENGNPGSPFDKMIPLYNESCLPVFQVRPSIRADKALPKELDDATSCIISRPFEKNIFEGSRVNLTTLYMAPQYVEALYPLDLLVAQSKEGERTEEPSTEPIACWNAKVNLGEATWKRETGVEFGYKRDPENECSVSLDANQGDRIGYRWNMTAMAYGACLGLAVCEDDEAKNRPYPGHCERPEVYQSTEAVATGCASFSIAKGSAPANQVKTHYFTVRNWGGDDEQANTSEVINFYADMCPGSQFEKAQVSLSWSPLIIDVAGKGIEVSRTYAQSVAFDIHNEGKKVRIDWPLNTSDVAFLIKPGVTKVESLKHLFGDDRFANGFEALKEFDTNKDGLVNAKDKEFKNMQLWFDRNRDGISDKGELVSLASQGVTDIKVSYERPIAGQSAERKILTSTYLNSKKKKAMNVEDQYFYEYKE